MKLLHFLFLLGIAIIIYFMFMFTNGCVSISRGRAMDERITETERKAKVNEMHDEFNENRINKLEKLKFGTKKMGDK